VEAAVSFPLLVLLLLAIVEGALYVHALHVVLGAAREGAHARLNMPPPRKQWKRAGPELATYSRQASGGMPTRCR